MGNCLKTLTGIAGKDCEKNLAGIKIAYIAQFDNKDAATSGATIQYAITGDTNSEIVSIDFSGATNYSQYWRAYEFAKSTGSLTSTMTKNEQNGVRFYTNESSLVFNKMEADTNTEIQNLAAGHLIAILEDLNHNQWMIGYEQYASATAVTSQSGVATEDLNGYNITLQAQEAQMPIAVKNFTYSAD